MLDLSPFLLSLKGIILLAIVGSSLILLAGAIGFHFLMLTLSEVGEFWYRISEERIRPITEAISGTYTRILRRMLFLDGPTPVCEELERRVRLYEQMKIVTNFPRKQYSGFYGDCAPMPFTDTEFLISEQLVGKTVIGGFDQHRDFEMLTILGPSKN